MKITADPSAWGLRLRRLLREYPRFELSAVELVRELREESLLPADRNRAGRRNPLAESSRL